jgi:hypothetical protein
MQNDLNQLAQYASYALTTFVTAGCGAYLGSYLRKKGENKAIHEDIGKLVDQMKTVTQATKEIEAKISDDIWNRQRRWELKRELLLETVSALAEVERAMSIYTLKFGPKQPGERRNTEGLEKLWNDSLVMLKRGRIMAAMLSGPAVVKAFEDIERYVGQTVKTYGDAPGTARPWLPEFRQLTAVVIDFLSQEILLTPRSSESSAVPTPEVAGLFRKAAEQP